MISLLDEDYIELLLEEFDASFLDLSMKVELINDFTINFSFNIKCGTTNFYEFFVNSRTN